MFRLGAVIGGAAKRASEILEEERKEAMDTVNEQLKIWTEMGLPKVRARKEAMRAKDKIFESLESEGFSLPQIAAIMGQGRGEATLDHIQSQRNSYDEYVVKPAEIAAISPSYEDTGLTKDMILENVMGKVNKGSTVTDAVASLSGQGDGTLTSLFGGNLSGISKRRMDAFATAAGVDINELRALASDDITYDQPLVEGDIRLIDPATAATKERALEESQTGLTTTNTFNRNALEYGFAFSGSDATFDYQGNIIYGEQGRTRALQARTIVSKIVAEYQQETGKRRFDLSDELAVQKRIDEALKAEGIYNPGQSAGAGAGQGGGQGGSGTGQGKGNTSTNPYLGYGSVSNLISDAIADGRGATTAQQSMILAQAGIAMQAQNVPQADIDIALDNIKAGF